MSDFEMHPIGTAARIAKLEALLRAAEPYVEVVHDVALLTQSGRLGGGVLRRIHSAVGTGR